MLVYKSPAKINLTLELINRRKDDYHNISTIMQTINIFDIITYELDENILISSNIKELNSETNLIFKSIDLMQNTFSIKQGIKICLNKNIPLSSGLGGGSSNAATTLIALNLMWGLHLDSDELISLAQLIGSDVPFFISRGTALISGKGEKIKQLPNIKPMLFLLLHNETILPNKTYSMYKAISSNEYTSGQFSNEIASMIESGQQLQNAKLFNCFDKIAPIQFPTFKKHAKSLEELGFNEYHLAGSGPTIMVPIKTRTIAKKVKFALWDRYSIPSTIIQTTSSNQKTYVI